MGSVNNKKCFGFPADVLVVDYWQTHFVEIKAPKSSISMKKG